LHPFFHRRHATIFTNLRSRCGRLLPSTRTTSSFNSNDFFCKSNTSPKKSKLQHEQARNCELSPSTCNHPFSLHQFAKSLWPTPSVNSKDFFLQLERFLPSTRVTSSASRTPQPKSRSCGSFNANKLETANFHSRLASILSPSTCSRLHRLAKSLWPAPSFNSSDFFLQLE